jgi:hypothetical protein
VTSIIVNKRQLPNQDTARVVPTIIYTTLMGKFVYSRGAIHCARLGSRGMPQGAMNWALRCGPYTTLH